MKKLLLAALVLGSVNIFAQEMDIVKCSQKVGKAIKAVASLEIGKHVKISDHAQDSLSTAANMVVTVINTKKPAQLIYAVKTVDLSDESRCVISNIELK